MRYQEEIKLQYCCVMLVFMLESWSTTTERQRGGSTFQTPQAVYMWYRYYSVHLWHFNEL
jgi:hypothetical protein